MDSDSRRLWENHWHPICHRSEVSRARDFVRLEIGDEECVAFNDGSNVVLFDNLCPHRGARIFDGTHGNARFLCQYHGWSYANGRLFGGGGETMLGTPLDRICLNTYQTQWVGDWLFGSKHAAISLADQLGDAWPILEGVSLNCVERRDFNAYVFDADWRIAVENALEPYHIGAVHRNSLDRLGLEAGENQYFGVNSLWRAPLGNLKLDRSLQRLSGLFDIKDQYRGYWSLFLFPFSMISSTYGYSYSLQNFLPGDRERCNFVSRLYASRLRSDVGPEAAQPLIDGAALMNRQVFEEDHEICRRVPFKAWRPEPPQAFAASEEKVVHFRSSYRAAIATRGA